MKANFAILLACALATTATGCKVTREFEKYEELRDAKPPWVRVMARDTSIFELSYFTITDSLLHGSGEHIIRGKRSSFSGAIPLNDLVYIQGEDGSFIRSVIGIAAVTTAVVCIASSMDHHGLTIWRPQGSSCPYVYVWDGEQYVVQGEAFGTSFGRGLESTTTCMLPAAFDRCSIVRVRMTNERPESHYVNSAALFAYGSPEPGNVFLDTQNRGWAITDPQSPTLAPPELISRDTRWWKSDLRAAQPRGTYRDAIEVTVPRASGATQASLVVHAINTRLISAVYDIVFGYLGDASLEFLHQVENDPELIADLRGWIRECSLKLEIWKEDRWVEAGLIPPEANDVSFSKLVRIDASGILTDEIRVRMSCLADTWMIDAVEVDWTPTMPLTAHPVPLRSARHSGRGAAEEPIRETDGRHILIMPGESIDMEFDAFRSVGSERVQYAFAASGYLYEWLPDPAGADPIRAMFASLGPDRVAVVNSLVRHREAFLWPLYKRWRETVEEHPEMRRAPGEGT